jgi:hypothetical protein
VHYTILDSQGNVLRSFEDPQDATLAMQEMSDQTDEDLFLLRYDETGQPVGDAFTTADLKDARARGLLATMPGELIVGSLTAIRFLLYPRSYAAASHPTLTRRQATGAGEDAVNLSFSYHRDPTPA